MENLNWFLSTLSQSAAAIVGLIGALLGGRLINQIDEIKQRRFEVKKRVKNFFDGVDAQLVEFEKFRKFVEQRIPEYKKARDEGRNVMAFPNNMGFTSSMGVIEIKNIKGDLSRLEFVKEILPELVEVWEKPKEVKKVEELENCYNSIEKLRKKLDKRRKEFMVSTDILAMCELDCALSIASNWKASIERLIKDFQSFQKTLLPKYFIWLLILLSFITITSVFLPLTILYINNVSIRECVLISFFAIGVGGVIGFLIYQIESILRMGNSEKIVKESKEK